MHKYVGHGLASLLGALVVENLAVHGSYRSLRVNSE